MKKRILFLITKSNWGGAQKYVFELATNLPQEKYEVAVALGGNGELSQRLKEAGVKVFSIDSLQRDISLYKELKSLIKISKIIREFDPDIIHNNSSKAGLLGAVLGRLLGVPKIVFTSHGWAFNEKRSLISKFIFKILHYLTIILSHQTIAVSGAVKDGLKWPGAQKKMSVIHLGIREPSTLSPTIARQKIMELAPALSDSPDSPWIISIGELHPTKQHNITIGAMPALLQKYPSVKLVIIGEGQERDSLNELITDKNLSDKVFLPGAISNAANYLKAGNVFVLSSISEAFGYVVLEAAKAAVPIIASKVGGVPEIVESGTEATLINNIDETNLADALIKHFEDEEAADIKATKAKNHSEKFTIENMCDNTASLYSNPL